MVAQAIARSSANFLGSLRKVQPNHSNFQFFTRFDAMTVSASKRPGSAPTSASSSRISHGNSLARLRGHAKNLSKVRRPRLASDGTSRRAAQTNLPTINAGRTLHKRAV